MLFFACGEIEAADALSDLSFDVSPGLRAAEDADLGALIRAAVSTMAAQIDLDRERAL